MKQTAVEWLCNEWLYIDQEFDMKLIDKKTYWERLKSVQEQAKAMEKEQMNKNTNFICHGCGTKHTGENDDQMYEVCKQCFINL